MTAHRIFNVNGKQYTSRSLADELGLNTSTAYYRLNQHAKGLFRAEDVFQGTKKSRLLPRQYQGRNEVDDVSQLRNFEKPRPKTRGHIVATFNTGTRA